MEIVKLKPAVKDYLWGGTNLAEKWGKDLGGKACIAECWELSLHEDGLSVIDSGELKGRTLKEALNEWGVRATGQKAADFAMFPQLIKFIDAKQSLSIQVHPADDYALKNEKQYGKTEVWYIVDACEGAGIYWGFKDKITKDEFRKSIENDTVCDVLQFVEAKAGDVFFIEAGTVHAICKGITLAEIQQNSNITYRVYDYGRIGADGKPRPLHIDKAIDVSVTAPPVLKKQPQKDGETYRKIAENKYFDVSEYILKTPLKLNSGSETFNALVFIDGAGQVLEFSGNEKGQQTKLLDYAKGETFFVPAGTEYEILPNEKTTVLLSKV